jgi:hypothetical protein
VHIPVQSGHRFRLNPGTFWTEPEREAMLDNECNQFIALRNKKARQDQCPRFSVDGGFSRFNNLLVQPSREIVQRLE